MRRMIIITTGAMIALATTSTTLAGDRNEFIPSSGEWHDPQNWSENEIPDLTWDVLIASGKTCTVSGSNNDALCKSLEVSGTLEIQDGNTLQIRTPVSHGFTALEVNGLIEFSDDTETGILLLEMTGSGDRVFEILGEGQITGDPAEMQTDSGSNAIDRLYVGPLSEGAPFIAGPWTIPLDVENDGTFIAGSGTMLFERDGDVLDIGGAGTFRSGGGTMRFNCVDFDPGLAFTGTLLADAGTMYLTDCGPTPKARSERGDAFGHRRHRPRRQRLRRRRRDGQRERRRDQRGRRDRD